MEAATAPAPSAPADPGTPGLLTVCKVPTTTTPLPSPGIAIEPCSDSKPDTASGSRPPPLPLVEHHDLHRNLTSPAAPSTSGWQSPARHHRRTPSQHREIKETKDARTEYTNDDIDGRSQHRINQYRIIEEIGRGSYGAVHRAVDQYGKEFAVKEFSKTRLRRRAQSLIMRRPPGPGFRRPIRRAATSVEEPKDSLHLIRQEIAIMKKLHHDNLVELIEVLDDPEEDSLYMVLEMCKKGTVMKIEVGQPAPPLEDERVRYAFRDLLLGIEYLHGQSICHRDIKPDNLLVTSDDVLKIVDFGVSEMFDKPGDMKTARNAGSPAFMSPELCGKHDKVSGTAADIWSMGTCLYCFKYGHLPFEHDNPLDMYEAIKNDPLTIPGDEEPLFADLIRRLLEKDPNERITMPKLRDHPWVTKNGTDPLLAAEENCSDVIEMPNPLEVNHAFTRKMSHIVCVLKAIRKFLALLEKSKVASSGSNRRLSSFENGQQASSVEEALRLVQERQKFVSAKANVEKAKRPSAPSSPTEGKNFYLGVGTGDRDEFREDQVPRDVVSDSPVGADFDIYDQAFGAEVENIKSREQREGREKTVFLTRFVGADPDPSTQTPS
ncbi:hypothetical protein MKZ38_003397 [Zalerion maritima]|uniref:Protein kinase domain-containing protein n=1 Tax=Zalerion maritima TaxID=339359 RepID=A0AAD5RNU6_9PEZI|nr:hypothetical protein MKZ38_003397 [Zalerion maritima]